MRIHLLDMGDEKYGDCILVQEGGLTVLVDGGHAGDFARRGSAPSIPDQLAAILGVEPPFRVDLLVVTHCHGDHIGCLPRLVEDGVIAVGTALIADEDLGFPDIRSGRDAVDDEVIAKVVAGLREEPRADFASDAEVDRFLTDAATLETRYRDMVAALENGGSAKVVRFRGTDDEGTRAELAALERSFSNFGLKVLGPEQEHLLLCTEAIDEFSRAAAGAARSRRRMDAAEGPPSEEARRLFLSLSRAHPADGAVPDDISRFLDRPGKGAALNDQSILLKVGDGPGAALLTGDMQFADAEVDRVAPLMEALLAKVLEAGPYAFVKLPHHGSYNGFDERVARDFDGTKVFGISTGRGDPGHPHEDVLALLGERRRQVRWVRTDKNGAIFLDLEGGEVEITKSQGRVNDASPNRGDAAPADPEPPAPGPRPGQAPAPVRQPRTEIRQSSSGEVEVFARIPHVRTRVTITVDVEPGGGGGEARREPSGLEVHQAAETAPPPKPDGTPRLAAGRPLPPLVFATHMPTLVRNVGEREARSIGRAIEAAGQRLLDVGDPAAPFDEVADAVGRGDTRGVVIVGGYDVLPAVRYDVLPAALRSQLGAEVRDDPDEFIVWSDQLYGDRDRDGMGDIPVSRVPDGRSADLLLSALCGPAANPRAMRFGLRNVARPFAERVFKALPGPQELLVSEPARTKGIEPATVDATAIYLMLHGSDRDKAQFWGETQSGGMLAALSVGNIPDPCGGVVFAGCCWGALTVATSAANYNPVDPLQPLIPAQSIALSFLSRGARAFVGCTGAHYSPFDDNPRANLDYFGGPLHRAFWSSLLEREEPPAQALFSAKMAYIKDMPHGRASPAERAIEFKTLRQFTCLGLGW